MKAINFAIVGCGFIAKKHADAISKIKEANLVAVCDTVPANMEFFVETYGATSYTDIDDLLKDPAVDVVNICTPSGSHSILTQKTASAGKHVIVEKPIALSLTDTNKMVEVCKENNVKLSVLHPNRFRPVMMELRELYDKGSFGKMSHANATVRWNRNQEYYDQAPWRGTKEFDGGVLMNQAIHNLDLLIWFMGEPEEVFSMEATRFRNIEAEDVSVGVVRFKSGALGVIEAATTIYPKNFEESLAFFGEKGTVKVGGANANFIQHLVLEGMDQSEVEKLQRQIEEDPFGKPGHQWIIEDMVQAINLNKEPAVNGLEGKKALELVLALYKSAESGKPVKLSELNDMEEVRI